MLLDSLQHAKDDMQQRALVEAQTEAQVMLNTTEAFLQKNSNFLSAEERQTTRAHMEALQQKSQSGTKDEIQQAIEALNEVSKPYAERLMDEAIGQALKGKKI
jgi:molecular chaperone HscA